MNTLKQLTQFIKLSNIIMLFVFILQNSNTLNAIPFTNPFTSQIFHLSILSILGVVAVILGIVIAAGTTVVGSGLNEESTANIRKLLFGMLELTIYITPLSFYVFPFGQIGVIITLIDIVFILLSKIEVLGGENE